MDILPETDHNFSPPAAQQRYFEEICNLVRSVAAARSIFRGTSKE